MKKIILLVFSIYILVSCNSNNDINVEQPISNNDEIQVYNEPGVYNNDSHNTIKITSQDVIIENCIINGDLVLDEGINGEVTLNNVTITGQLTIHSEQAIVKLIGNSNIPKVETDSNNLLTLIVDEHIIIPELYVHGDVHLIIDGNAEIKKIYIKSGNMIDLQPGVKVRMVEIDTSKLIMNNEGLIESIEVNDYADNTIITGEGIINTVNVLGDNLNIDVVGTVLNIGDGVNGTLARGINIDGGTVYTVIDEKDIEYTDPNIEEIDEGQSNILTPEEDPEYYKFYKPEYNRPTLNNIIIENPIVKSGEELRVTFDAYDDSGVKEICIMILEPIPTPRNGGCYYPNENKSGTYTKNVLMYSYYKPGLWSIKYIHIEDIYGNGVYYYPKDQCPSGINCYDELLFELLDGGDHQAPEVSDFVINTPMVDAGQKFNMGFNLSDETGLKVIKIYYRDPNGHNYGEIFDFTGEKNKDFIFDLKIDKSAKPGKWEIKSIETRDIIGNIDYYHPTENTFYVRTPGDNQAPTYSNLVINTPQIEVGERVNISLSLHDDSGLKQIGVFLKSGSGSSWNLNGEKTQEFIINDVYYREGKHEIDYIKIEDVIGNIKRYYLTDVSFIVGEYTAPDREGPTYSNIVVNTPTVKRGEEYNIGFTVEDESGIKTLQVYLEDPAGDIFYYVINGDGEKSGEYSLINNVWDKAALGTWKMQKIMITDMKSNSSLYYPSNITFEVIGDDTLTDTNAPTYSNLVIDTPTVERGQDAYISLDVLDETEISMVCLLIEEPSGKNKEDCRNTSGGKDIEMTFKINIDTNADIGIWKVIRIQTKDIFGNWQFFYPSNVNFEVITGDIYTDTTGPTYTDLVINTPTIISGSEVEISIGVQDESGVSLLDIYLTGPDGSEINISTSTGDVTSGNFTLRKNIPSNINPGIWEVSKIIIWDTVRNSETYYPSNVSFEVIEN